MTRVTPPPKLVSVSGVENTASTHSSDPSPGGEPATDVAPKRATGLAMPSRTAKVPSSQRPIASQATHAPLAAHGGSHINPYPAFSLANSPGLRAPQNTPADHMPVAAIRPSHTAGTGAAGANHRPILFNSIMGRGVAHAITPGNTPSSLERITKRIAGNLLADGHGQAQAQARAQQNSVGVIDPGLGRIAPSYERRFVADLNDLEKRLAQVPKHTQQPPSPPAAVDSEGREGEAGTASPSQWPQTFAASVTHMRVPVAPLAPKHEL